MDWQLDAAETRVLGCLLEKEMATPEYYPLSLNALVNACNQKSSREPVVNYDEAKVEEALSGLRAQGLAVRITGPDSRVPKHGQRFTEKLNLGRREAAVMCLLMLRGPQTSGELRSRSGRLYDFEDLDSVENTLNRLGESGLVGRLARQAGFKESRYAHLLSAEPAAAPAADAETAAPEGSLRDRVAALEAEFAALRREFDDFKRRFE